MRLWDRIRRSDYWEGNASGAAVLTTTYGSPDREAILPQVTGAAQQSYGSNAVVFAAILARISLLSEARFQFKNAADSRLFGDERLSILEHPWPDGTTGELLARAEQDVCLAGNSFTWKAADDLLVRLRPDWTTIVSELVRDPLGRQYRRKIGYWYEPPKGVQGGSYGDPALFGADEVAHWAPIPDPSATFRGMSWMTPIVRDIIGDSALTSYKIKYLENAASPNMLIKYSQKLQPGTVDAIRERMQARYGGVDNSFKTLVLDQGADATVIGNSLSQMDFSGVQAAGSERILADAGVPGVIVGLEPLRGAGRGYQESMRKFADLWARPEWRSVCGALQKLVPGVPPSGIRLWFDTAEIAALQEGEMERAQTSLVHAQALLTLAQAGYERMSAVKAVQGNDVTLLQLDPNPPLIKNAVQEPPQTQHLLPQPPGSGPGVTPLPKGSTPRLAIGSTSPADGGNGTRPSRRVAAVRR